MSLDQQAGLVLHWAADGGALRSDPDQVGVDRAQADSNSRRISGSRGDSDGCRGGSTAESGSEPGVAVIAISPSRTALVAAAGTTPMSVLSVVYRGKQTVPEAGFCPPRRNVGGTIYCDSRDEQQVATHCPDRRSVTRPDLRGSVDWCVAACISRVGAPGGPCSLSWCPLPPATSPPSILRCCRH